MKRVELTLPQFLFVVGTRAMLGTGIGLLVSGRLRRHWRRNVGLALLAAGAVATVPSALLVFGRKQTVRAAAPGESRAASVRA
jgi:hypothetical protein